MAKKNNHKTIGIVCGVLVAVAAIVAVVIVVNSNNSTNNANNANSGNNSSSAEEKPASENTNNKDINNGNTSNGSNTGSTNDQPVSSIVGRWQYNDNELTNANVNFIYIFNADGTGEYDAAGSVMKFTYETNGNKLTIHYDNLGDFSTEYEINGDTLNVKDSGNADTIYKLVK